MSPDPASATELEEEAFDAECDLSDPNIRLELKYPTVVDPIAGVPLPRLRALLVDSRCRVLQLRDMEVSDALVSSLVDVLLAVAHNVDTLLLARNPLSPESAKSLARLLENEDLDALKPGPPLTLLELTDTAMGDLGAVFLSEALASNAFLEELWLNGCRVTDVGIQHIAGKIEVHSDSLLRLVNLSGNQITAQGVIALLRAAKKPHVFAELRAVEDGQTIPALSGAQDLALLHELQMYNAMNAKLKFLEQLTSSKMTEVYTAVQQSLGALDDDLQHGNASALADDGGAYMQQQPPQEYDTAELGQHDDLDQVYVAY